jgi:hypothetical protein
VINKPKIPTLITNATNWDLFRTYIEDHINMNIKIKEADELDQATQYLTTLSQEAAWYSTPTPPNKTTNMYNIPVHIRELVEEKSRERNRCKTHRTIMTELIITESNDDCQICWLT